LQSSVQPLQCTADCKDQNFDGIILICQSYEQLPDELECLKAPLQDYSAVDCCVGEEISLTKIRNVTLATKLNKIRNKTNALLFLLLCSLVFDFSACLYQCNLVIFLCHQPLEVREHKSSPHKVAVLGIWVKNQAQGEAVTELATALESGRLVYRDIGGSDPERMAAPRVAEYVQAVFKDSPVTVTVVSNLNTLEKEYPCLAAVNRCANTVPRHQARVIKLLYCGEGPIQQTLMVVGKGITYDTGGADIKAGGIMAGMHRDKCGSAAVAGFFQILAKLKPKHLKVVGAMAMVRNSVGSDCYVADELVVSRAGRRIRVGNTDAEGRMVMVDLLCEMKEQALKEVSPQLFTIATLTGHAIRAMGPHYSIIMDNGAAQRSGNALQWQKAGEVLGDLFEVSTIRREDYEFHKGKSEYEEILQSNNLPSSATPRGHQTPAAFLIMASGLDKHGVDSDKPLPYSHIDIAGSSGPFPGVPTGAPILAMATKYLEL
uniref:Putative aminopeptidase W07G4.4 n=1 Tax=Sinocyclocheilus rhinocerous TaxID=307959 RepID=A0A673G9R5_9TELE